jgi:hypothetical protein
MPAAADSLGPQASLSGIPEAGAGLTADSV